MSKRESIDQLNGVRVYVSPHLAHFVVELNKVKNLIRPYPTVKFKTKISPISTSWTCKMCLSCETCSLSSVI